MDGLSLLTEPLGTLGARLTVDERKVATDGTAGIARPRLRRFQAGDVAVMLTVLRAARLEGGTLRWLVSCARASAAGLPRSRTAPFPHRVEGPVAHRHV